MRRFSLLPAVVALVLALPGGAVPPERRSDGTVPEDSRWASFTRIIYGRWDMRAQAPAGDAASAKAAFWRCVEDAWFVANSSIMRGANAPCTRIMRSAHPYADPGSAGEGAHAKFRAEFSHGLAPAGFSAFHACSEAALDANDPDLLEICAFAMGPRERAVAALADEDRFSTWFGACKRVLLADAPSPQPISGGEEMKTAKKVMTELERTQAQHCFRSLPSLYQVRGVQRLSDVWTPEEQKALYLRSQQLGGQN